MKYSSVTRLVLDDIFVLPIYSGLVFSGYQESLTLGGKQARA